MYVRMYVHLHVTTCVHMCRECMRVRTRACVVSAVNMLWFQLSTCCGFICQHVVVSAVDMLCSLTETHTFPANGCQLSLQLKLDQFLGSDDVTKLQ